MPTSGQGVSGDPCATTLQHLAAPTPQFQKALPHTQLPRLGCGRWGLTGKRGPGYPSAQIILEGWMLGPGGFHDSTPGLEVAAERAEEEPRWLPSQKSHLFKVQFNRSVVSNSATPWTAAVQSRYSKLHLKLVHKPSQVIHGFVYTASVP